MPRQRKRDSFTPAVPTRQNEKPPEAEGADLRRLVFLLEKTRKCLRDEPAKVFRPIPEHFTSFNLVEVNRLDGRTVFAHERIESDLQNGDRILVVHRPDREETLHWLLARNQYWIWQPDPDKLVRTILAVEAWQLWAGRLALGRLHAGAQPASVADGPEGLARWLGVEKARLSNACVRGSNFRPSPKNVDSMLEALSLDHLCFLLDVEEMWVRLKLTGRGDVPPLPSRIGDCLSTLDALEEAEKWLGSPSAPPGTPPRGGEQQPRLCFDEDTHTFTLDGVPYPVEKPKAFALYRAIAEKRDDSGYIKDTALQALIPGTRGEKTIPRLLKTLPQELQATLLEDNQGRFVRLPRNVGA